MKSTHISSPETDRKVAWYGSVVFMVVAWLALAGFLARALIEGDPEGWGIAGLIPVTFCLLALLFIPFQLVRYFREKRESR